ncbi:sugar transferase [Pedobacter antarcticus]|uniref:sugar transferase n=1 Tax=Pedobacter antarcticus TaxID=34086 RepID=UPI00088DCE80|nr:sugar transferase [Pedobacter antarcticus]SDM17125.1 Sugar transferase involved in LPS biosynthesis (colanic, teichoic acid) [Pedobacter antarcticus]
MYRNYVKRLFDLLIASFGLILLSPLLLLVFTFLYFANDGKPFFFQIRPGRKGRLFKIIKFKTMNDKLDSNGHLLSDAVRLTPIGHFVRKTSLDEIPQLINVLKGEMSLIGPRPLLPEYLPLYSKEQARRHDVRPGITGWAQVNGRNAISWNEKFKFDTWYVEHVSFWLDLKILFLTVKKVVIKEGISSDTSVTMEKFKGK